MADDLDGLINIDEDDSGPQKESTVINERVESADGEEDGEDDYSGSVMSDESGSGSGDGGDETTGTQTTTDSSIVDVTVVSPSVTSTTEMENEITEGTSKSTEESENGDENMYGGGVNTVRNNFAEAQGQGGKGGKDMVGEKVPKVLTTEVIAAVVVGAVCAVILIAFLVYRLRKRDEGSYALSDGGYKDTYKLQADTGKEAFV